MKYHPTSADDHLQTIQHAVWVLGWSNRHLADRLAVNERQVRRWMAGATVPQPIADWLGVLAAFVEDHPAPPPQRGMVE